MAVQSKFLEPGKKYLADKQYYARYKNIERDISGSSNSHFFYSPPPKLKFSKCNLKRCLTCPNASFSQCDDDSNLFIFCKAYIITYKQSWNICNITYIGKTFTPLHLRTNQHRSDSNNYESS